MNNDPAVLGLLADWEERRDRGEAVAPEELCAAAPHLAAELRRLIHFLDACDRLLDVEASVPAAGVDRAADAPAPARIGAYVIEGELGRGGMGVVYRAWDPALCRTVALKVLQPAVPLLTAEDTRRLARRFRQEGQALARLRHESIVPVYEAKLLDERPYFVMEYVSGGSLADHRERLTAAGPAAVVPLMERVARAVAYVHGQGVLHRDLKPGNILLVSGESVSGERSGATTHHSPLTTHQPKISDFGLAKLLDPDSAPAADPPPAGTPRAGDTAVTAEAATQLTGPGQQPGTWAYMAPEQFDPVFGPVGPATDVWALGVVLYELLTGRRPFPGRRWEELREQVCGGPGPPAWGPGPPSRLRPRRPWELEAICRKCLAKDPARRYRSAEALAEDLGRWLRREPTEARPPGWAARAGRVIRRHRAAGAAALAAAGLLAALATAAWYADPDRPARQVESEVADADSPVELIGPGGGPRWQRWRAGGRQSSTSLAPDGTFSVHSWGVGLLELLRDPQHDRFRLTAQVRHEKSDDFGDVGLYFCHAERREGDVKIHSFLQLTFNDVRDHAGRVQRLPPDLNVRVPPGNAVNFQARLYATDNTAERCDTRIGDPQGTLYFTPAGFAGGGWRRLVVDASPDAVRATWEGDTPVGVIRVADLSEPAAEVLAERGLARAAGPGRPAAPPPFPSRGSVGVYILRGSASFRSVTIEPLKDSSTEAVGGEKSWLKTSN